MAKRMYKRAGNGGFPEPPADDLQRLVRVRHGECGAETRVRLPRGIPARVVQRVVCDHCETTYECGQVEEIGLLDAGEAIARSQTLATEAGPRKPRRLSSLIAGLPRPSLPHLPNLESRAWRWVSALLAAAAVVAILLIVQGGDSDAPEAGTSQPATVSDSDKPASTRAIFVTEPGFSLALPPGWERTPAKGGAAFSASSVDGSADATLWIERAPGLTFREFETRSLAQLESLAGNAEVVERIPAPTMEGTVVRLRANTPPESGVSAPYDVTLRAAGPYRYYLSTLLNPGASRQATEGADLIHGSFVPEPEGGSEVTTTETPGSEDSPTPEPTE